MKKVKNGLQEIQGVGKSIERDFNNIGIKKISDLKNKDPQELYEKICKFQNIKVDRCILYVFREAVYYAKTPKDKIEEEKLKWWYWKDGDIL